MKDTFTKYRILFHRCFFNTLNTSSSCLQLPWFPMRNQLWILLRNTYLWQVLLSCCFQNSLCFLAFDSSIIIYLGMGPFQFTLLGVHWVSQTCRFMYFIKFVWLKIFLLDLSLSRLELQQCICCFAWWFPQVPYSHFFILFPFSSLD